MLNKVKYLGPLALRYQQTVSKHTSTIGAGGVGVFCFNATSNSSAGSAFSLPGQLDVMVAARKIGPQIEPGQDPPSCCRRIR